MRTASGKFSGRFALAMAIVFLVSLLQQSSRAQTFNIIYTFTGHGSSANPLPG
ncbi:MAG TPA: hypothetical protein VL240_00550 [Candidatus Binatia bacterium]|nr:hypothetical protein [Candidatus Binatia bacterium]